MKLLEKIFLIIVLISVILRAFMLPGSNALFVFSIFFTSLVYLGAGFWVLSYRVKAKEIKENNIGVSIGIGITLWFALLGVLFKVMTWPGASLYLTTGSILLAVFLFICTMLYYNEEKNKTYYQLLIKRMAPILLICVTVLYLDGNTIFRFFHRNDPVQIQKWEYMRANPDDMKANEDYYKYEDSK